MLSNKVMMIAPNSIVCQKEGAQGEEEEVVEGQTGTLTLAADGLTGPTRSGVSDVRNRRKYGRWCGILLYRKGRDVVD